MDEADEASSSEEEEDETWSQPSRRPTAPDHGSREEAAPAAGGGLPADSPRPYDDDEFEPPCQDDVLFAAADLARTAWDSCNTAAAGGLRQRRAADSDAAGAPRTAAWGGCLDDEDFALGSERLGCPPPQAPSRGLTAVAWRPLCALVLGVASALCILFATRPRQASWQTFREGVYEDQLRPPKKEDGGLLRNASEKSGGWLPLASDRSLEGRHAWARYVDHGAFALGTAARSVAGVEHKQKKAVPRKVYEHKYLGILGIWVPVPYLPQPGRQPGHYGVGLCVLGKCACVPDFRRGKAERMQRSCMRFRGGKSAALNVMAIPNGVLFFLWQWQGYWSRLAAHATLSLANLRRGRIWVLAAAPFSHRSWGDMFTSGVLLANVVDSFDRTDASFAIFMMLYLGGCWSAWFARGVIWRRLMKNDSSAFYSQELGAAGGLAALLVFLARARPDERFQFSLYMVPMPLQLSAWQSLFAHGFLRLAMSKGELISELLATSAAWCLGWVMYSAWELHD